MVSEEYLQHLRNNDISYLFARPQGDDIVKQWMFWEQNSELKIY
jgi:hypothetical protein